MSQFRAKFNKYDLTFSEFIRLRDKVCQRCSKSGKLECSHIHSRKNMGTRCDPDNAKALCNTCHRWWHSNPLLSSEWIRGVMGDDAYYRLMRKAKAPTKMTTADKDFIRAEQKEQINQMEKGSLNLEPFNARLKR